MGPDSSSLIWHHKSRRQTVANCTPFGRLWRTAFSPMCPSLLCHLSQLSLTTCIFACLSLFISLPTLPHPRLPCPLVPCPALMSSRPVPCTHSSRPVSCTHVLSCAFASPSRMLHRYSFPCLSLPCLLLFSFLQVYHYFPSLSSASLPSTMEHFFPDSLSSLHHLLPCHVFCFFSYVRIIWDE